MMYTKRIIINVPSDTRGWGENKRILPALTATVEVSFDYEAVAQHFGAKAARSKGKTSRLLSGKGKVKVITVKEST